MELPVCAALILLFSSGLLLSRIRFCMVASVALALRGQWTDAKAILLISSIITLVLTLLHGLEHRPLVQYEVTLRVLLGGLLFGITAAWNRGCFVGTSIQLMTGDLRGLLSVAGWILGFRLLGMPMELAVLPTSTWRGLISLVAMGSLLVLLLSNGRRAEAIDNQEKPVKWGASLACGVMLALLDNDLWKWDPSSLAKAFAHPMGLWQAWQQGQGQVVFGLMLLAGMFVDGLLQKRLRWLIPSWCDWPRIAYGMTMAIGAVLAMGGNDSQLLRYLPSGSPHGWLAVSAMLLGIAGGLNISNVLKTTRS